MPHKYNEKMFDIKHLRETAEKLKNWGRWGPDDEIGTLNFITPEKVVDASKLIKRGKRFSLGLNFDRHGPQKGSWGNRFNPIHLMLATGTDAVNVAPHGPTKIDASVMKPNHSAPATAVGQAANNLGTQSPAVTSNSIGSIPIGTDLTMGKSQGSA